MTLEMRIRRNKRRQMLKRRRRFFGGVVGTVIVISTLMAIIGIPSISASSDEFRTVRVKSGDSLWSIVNEVCDEDINIRKVIAEVKEINNLESSCITVGESLVIPVYS